MVRWQLKTHSCSITVTVLYSALLETDSVKDSTNSCKWSGIILKLIENDIQSL